MRDLGEAVGIKSSSVMYHFKSKDGLMQEIASSYTDVFFDRLRDLEVRSPEPAARLQGLVDIFEEALSADKMCLCGMLAADSSQLDDRAEATVKRFFARMEEWVAEQLDGAGVTGVSAQLIVSSLEGAMLLDKLGSQPERLQVVRGWLASLLKS